MCGISASSHHPFSLSRCFQSHFYFLVLSNFHSCNDRYSVLCCWAAHIHTNSSVECGRARPPSFLTTLFSWWCMTGGGGRRRPSYLGSIDDAVHVWSGKLREKACIGRSCTGGWLWFFARSSCVVHHRIDSLIVLLAKQNCVCWSIFLNEEHSSPLPVIEKPFTITFNSIWNMSSYTTLVNVDRDTPVKLAHFVSQLLPANSQEFYTECNDLIEKSEVVPLIKKILDQSEYLLAMDRDTGTCCISTTIYYYLLLLTLIL